MDKNVGTPLGGFKIEQCDSNKVWRGFFKAN